MHIYTHALMACVHTYPSLALGSSRKCDPPGRCWAETRPRPRGLTLQSPKLSTGWRRIQKNLDKLLSGLAFPPPTWQARTPLGTKSKPQPHGKVQEEAEWAREKGGHHGPPMDVTSSLPHSRIFCQLSKTNSVLSFWLSHYHRMQSVNP